MSRIAFVWKDIWKDVAKHLVEAGSHPNSSILIFALDSLKQLAHKFLAKEELSSYKYQREFLQPFETILSNNLKRHDIVDFLVYCVADVCRKCGKNIKSGWSIVFNIIGLIGKSMENERVVTGSFGIFNEIIQMHYEYLAEYFEDVLSCLLQYCGNPITAVSLKGIERLNWAVSEISNQKSVLVTSLNAVLIPKEIGPESKPEPTIVEDSMI
jgi:brefeldin A-inhibited guanine nucleotide-exchange protein